MRTVAKSPPESAVEIWAYLDRWHADDAAQRRDAITVRVGILAELGLDAAAIYRAMSVGVRIFEAHKERLRDNASEKAVREFQLRIARDLQTAAATVEEWSRLWDNAYSDEVETLRELQSQFESHPILLDESARTSLPLASRPLPRKQPKQGARGSINSARRLS